MNTNFKKVSNIEQSLRRENKEDTKGNQQKEALECTQKTEQEV